MSALKMILKFQEVNLLMAQKLLKDLYAVNSATYSVMQASRQLVILQHQIQTPLRHQIQTLLQHQIQNPLQHQIQLQPHKILL